MRKPYASLRFEMKQKNTTTVCFFKQVHYYKMQQ